MFEKMKEGSIKHRSIAMKLFLVAVFAAAAWWVLFSAPTKTNEKGGEMEDPVAGGIIEVTGVENDLHTVELARFALDEHNKKANAGLEFLRVMNVKRQVVAGTIHHLTIEAVDALKNKKLLEAKVWEKPWEDFRSLQEINHLGDSST